MRAGMHYNCLTFAGVCKVRRLSNVTSQMLHLRYNILISVTSYDVTSQTSKAGSSGDKGKFSSPRLYLAFTALEDIKRRYNIFVGYRVVCDTENALPGMDL